MIKSPLKILVPVVLLLVISGCSKKRDHTPVLETSSVTPSYLSVQCSAVLYLEGDAKVVEKGFYWGRAEDVSTNDGKVQCGDGAGNFYGQIEGLESDVSYFVKAYAVNKYGISYGKPVIFKTVRPPLPDVTAINTFSILDTRASLQASLSSNTIGNVSSVGICCATHPGALRSDNSFTISGAPITFSGTMTGLAPNTLYYARAFATSSLGVAYSNEISFKTYYGSVTDIDGNSYPTVLIGDQEWMAENLRVTKYQDGTPVPYVTDDNTWANLYTDAYCFYNNTYYFNIYGKLYNWYAVNNPSNLAPAGWRIPTYNDFQTLLDNSGPNTYLAMFNGNANSTGFNIQLGGSRHQGAFMNQGMTAMLWTSDSYASDYANILSLAVPPQYLQLSYTNNQDGCNVRCIKN
jgi:uncharacterized protein (TIGR02145 family)